MIRKALENYFGSHVIEAEPNSTLIHIRKYHFSHTDMTRLQGICKDHKYHIVNIIAEDQMVMISILANDDKSVDLYTSLM